MREDAVLGLTALCGDLPANLLSLLPGSVEWTKRIVSALVKDGLLKRHQKNNVSSLRLTKKGRELLSRVDPERFSPIFTEAYLSRCRKSSPTGVERIHRMAEIFLLMLRVGVSVYPDEKPGLFSDNPTTGVVPVYPSFYSSIEIKSKGGELTRIQATRAAGVLLAGPDDIYLVYHTGSAPLKWSSKAEQKMMGVIKGMLLGRGISVSEVKAIMIGADMGTASLLMRSEGGVRRQYFRPDGTFSALHYIPSNQSGIPMLRLFCKPDTREAIAARLRAGREAPFTPRYDCDAVEDGKAVLFAHEFDMERLRRYRNGLEMFGESGILHCFDFQAECLRERFAGLAEVRPIDSQTIWKELNSL